jgi:L-asparaginase / beta-aspartyl-peptidase
MKPLIFLTGLLSVLLAAWSPLRAGDPPASAGWVLVIHGGVGVPSRNELPPVREAAYRKALGEALEAGQTVLSTNGTSLDAVVAAIRVMEDSPLFNAGKGAALNQEGVAELDASIMEGTHLKAGAVAAVRRIKNPIEAARRVMDNTPHVLLVGPGADAFAQQQGLQLRPPEYFIIEERRKQLEEIQKAAREKKRADNGSGRVADRVGTVGAVALDRHGHLAAGTSTGGLAGKLPGRVGDSAIIGAGTYANNASCAVSGTGQGEFFIRASAARDIAALVEYRKMPLQEAADTVVLKTLTGMKAEAGIIALDRMGTIATPYNTEGMFRGSVRSDGQRNIAIYDK